MSMTSQSPGTGDSRCQRVTSRQSGHRTLAGAFAQTIWLTDATCMYATFADRKRYSVRKLQCTKLNYIDAEMMIMSSNYDGENHESVHNSPIPHRRPRPSPRPISFCMKCHDLPVTQDCRSCFGAASHAAFLPGDGPPVEMHAHSQHSTSIHENRRGHFSITAMSYATIVCETTHRAIFRLKRKYEHAHYTCRW